MTRKELSFERSFTLPIMTTFTTSTTTSTTTRKTMSTMGILLLLTLASTTATTTSGSASSTTPPPPPMERTNDQAEKTAMRVTGGSFVFPPETAFPPPSPTTTTSSSSTTTKTKRNLFSSTSTTRQTTKKIMSNMRQKTRPMIFSSSVTGAAATGGWYLNDDDDVVEEEKKQEGGRVVVKPQEYQYQMGITNYEPPSTSTATTTTEMTPAATATTTGPTSLISTPSTSNIIKSSSSTSNALSPEAIMYMSLLALQFGLQPILVRKFTPQNICRSSVVLVQEVVKFVIAFGIYFGFVGGGSSSGSKGSGALEGRERRKRELDAWNVKTWLTLAGLPAALYTVQNMASLLAYQNLEALTFNVLNQTKILSAALCCFLVMGKKQSKMQLVSLCMLLSSALVIEKIVSLESLRALLVMGGGGGGGVMRAVMGGLGGLRHLNLSRRVTHGVIPVLLASFISGLAGALTQKNLQGVSKTPKKSDSAAAAAVPTVKKEPRNAYLFSMEMNVASTLILITSMFFSQDGKKILAHGFFHNWTPQTLIPVLTNSIGGIIVGLVTKHAGSVRKGFALIFGLLLSGVIQALGSSSGIRTEHVVGGIIAAVSLWLHTTNPHKPLSPQQQLQEKEAMKQNRQYRRMVLARA